jgi:hypothetical protein
LHAERCFTPCSHGPKCFGAYFRFVPLVVNSSLDVSVFSASPTPGTSILTRGRQTVVIISAPTEVPANDTTASDLVNLKVTRTVTQDNNARNHTREALCDSPVATQSSFSRPRHRPRPVRCTRRCPSRCPTASPSRPTDVAPTPGHHHHQRFLNLTGARTSPASPAARVVALRFLAHSRRRRHRLNSPALHPRPRPHRRPPSRSTFMPSSASEDASS